MRRAWMVTALVMMVGCGGNVGDTATVSTTSTTTAAFARDLDKIAVAAAGGVCMASSFDRACFSPVAEALAEATFTPGTHTDAYKKCWARTFVSVLDDMTLDGWVHGQLRGGMAPSVASTAANAFAAADSAGC